MIIEQSEITFALLSHGATAQQLFSTKFKIKKDKKSLRAPKSDHFAAF